MKVQNMSNVELTNPETTIEYAGLVDLKLNIKDKTFLISQHNLGQPALHESICRYLAGQYRGSYDIPSSIDVRHSGVSILLSRIELTGKSYAIDINQNYYVLCNALLSYNQIITTVDPSETYTLVLCCERDPNVIGSQPRDLATLNIDGSSLAYITPGASAAIEWKLYIKNGVS